MRRQYLSMGFTLFLLRNFVWKLQAHRPRSLKHIARVLTWQSPGACASDGLPRSAVLARILPVVRASARSCECRLLGISVRCKIWQKYYDQSKGKAKAWNSESDATAA